MEFIKANIRLEGVEKASVEDSKKVVEICTQYAQKGMFNIFLTVFFSTLAFAFVEPFFFIGYLISIAIFGLYQAIFMANAGGAWDNAKKVVEVDLKMKGTPLHDATVVGDTVGDPFKDTSSVAMNPVIKFTTLFGLLAVELAVSIANPTGQFGENGPMISHILALVFFLISAVFVWRSFYAMRIGTLKAEATRGSVGCNGRRLIRSFEFRVSSSRVYVLRLATQNSKLGTRELRTRNSELETMSTSYAKPDTLIAAALAPLDWTRAVSLVVAFSLLMALAAQIVIPIGPVPITGQTFAVLLTGALLGSRLGAMALIVYLIEGASGLPFFYGGSSGIAHLLGPTGGYLIAFPAAAFITGAFAEHGWDKRFLTAAASMAIGSV